MISINNVMKNAKKRILTYFVLALLCTIMPFSTANAAEINSTTEETEQAEEAVFDAAFYAATYPDVVAVLGNDEQLLYMHYVNFGKAEGRFANAEEAAAATSAQVPQADQAAAIPTVKEGSYNILAIGNSITLHPVCGYWWGSWGMAASSKDKDYIHQVQAGLSEKYETVNLDIISVQSWETSSNRSRQLSKFDEKLANKYDLVVIQLGENVNNMTTFKKDFNKLVSYVKAAQPEAQIVIVGDYWYRSGRDSAKSQVAANQGCNYVDISSIRGKKAYRASSGTKVLGDDGKQHTIRNQAVLKHPNDLGMKYIADKILEAISL